MTSFKSCMEGEIDDFKREENGFVPVLIDTSGGG